MNWKELRRFWSTRVRASRPLRLVTSPVLIALVLFSLAVRWHEGYWPLTWSEWQYRSLLQRQERVTRDMNALWEQPVFPRGSGSGGRKAFHERIRQRVAPLRRDYEDFLVRNPSHHRAMTSYGVFLDEMGQPEDAVCWWMRALEISKDNPALLSNLGSYFGHAGQPMAAIHYFETAIALAPDEAAYHFSLANMYYLFRAEAAHYHHWSLEQVFGKALEEFRLARECDRSSFEYASSYAETYYGVNSTLHNEPWDAALRAWDHCMAMNLTPEQKDFVRVHMVRIHSYRRDPAACVKLLSEIRTPVQRHIATRIVGIAFPDSFSSSQEI